MAGLTVLCCTAATPESKRAVTASTRLPAGRSGRGFQHQFYDQNLGWLEGRYLSFYKFIKYITGLSTFGKRALAPHGLDRGKSMGQGFKDAYGYTEDIDGNEFYDDQKANMLLKNVYRTLKNQ